MSFLTKDKRKQISIIMLFGICFLALLWRCFKGFDWSDESYYLATAYRFFRGDRLVIDDWNPSTLFTVLLLPFFYIYNTIAGDLDGIFLFLRISYVVLSFCIAIYMYRVMQKLHGEEIAVASTFLFLFYARFTILTFSYNTLAQCFFTLCILILYQSFCTATFSICSYLWFGVFVSITTIANPLFALFYSGFCVVLGIIYLKTKDTQEKRNYQIALLGSLATVSISILLFSIYLFKRVSLQELFQMFPIIMQENEYAKDASFIRQILRIPMAILRQYKYTMLPYVATIVYIMWKKYYKRVHTLKDIQITWILQIIILICNVFLSGKGKNIGISFIALTMFGFYLYLVQSKKNWKTIVIWYVIGILSAFLFYFASNTGIYAVASGCMYSAIAAIIVSKDVLEEYKEIRKKSWTFLKTGTIIGISMVLLSTIVLRLFFVYRDSRIGELTTPIELGPGKGIFTTKMHYEQYKEIYTVISENVFEDDKLLISKLLPWAYLCTKAQCVANTTWRIPLENQRMEEYYKVHSDKMPDVVFIVNENYGVTNNNNNMSSYWKKLLNTSDFKKQEFPSGIFYRRLK